MLSRCRRLGVDGLAVRWILESYLAGRAPAVVRHRHGHPGRRGESIGVAALQPGERQLGVARTFQVRDDAIAGVADLPLERPGLADLIADVLAVQIMEGQDGLAGLGVGERNRAAGVAGGGYVLDFQPARVRRRVS